MLTIVKTHPLQPANEPKTIMLQITIEKIARTDLKRAHEIISRSTSKTTKDGTRYFKSI